MQGAGRAGKGCPNSQLNLVSSHRCPQLDRLATYGASRATFVKVDVTKLEDIAVEYGVGGLPAFYVFEAGVKTAAVTSSTAAVVVAEVCGILGMYVNVDREPYVNELSCDCRSCLWDSEPMELGAKSTEAVPAPTSVPVMPAINSPLNVPVFPGGIPVKESSGPTSNATELARALNAKVLSLFTSFVGDDGKTVNYSALRTSEEFHDYVRLTAALQVVVPLGVVTSCYAVV
jgi:hypothetical protein